MCIGEPWEDDVWSSCLLPARLRLHLFASVFLYKTLFGTMFGVCRVMNQLVGKEQREIILLFLLFTEVFLLFFLSLLLGNGGTRERIALVSKME